MNPAPESQPTDPTHGAHVDAVVSGAGLVGSAVALGLADAGAQVALIEPQAHQSIDQPDHDRRTLVLNAASLNVLTHLGVIGDALARVPIERIVINRQGGLGHLVLDAASHAALIGDDTDPDAPYFGQVVVAAALGDALLERVVAHPNIHRYCPNALVGFVDHADRVEATLDDGTALSARVLVGADGNASPIRQQLNAPVERHDYGQSAMVFNCQAAKPQPHTAFERFTPQGPLALLPQARGRYGVVWIDDHDAIDEALSWSDEAMLARLHARFGPKLGAFANPSPRQSYPLIKQHTPKPVSGRVVLVGNAANAVHPVSAQGLNLGLRDVAGLVAALNHSSDWPDALQTYQHQRAADQRATLRYTDTLARTFAHRSGLVRGLGGLGLALHAAWPSLERRLVRSAMGFRQPRAELTRAVTSKPEDSTKEAT